MFGAESSPQKSSGQVSTYFHHLSREFTNSNASVDKAVCSNQSIANFVVIGTIKMGEIAYDSIDEEWLRKCESSETKPWDYGRGKIPLEVDHENPKQSIGIFLIA